MKAYNQGKAAMQAMNQAPANPQAVNAAPAQPIMTPGGPSMEERSEVVEEHLWRHGGPKFKNVQPKSYKILEQQLPQSAIGSK